MCAAPAWEDWSGKHSGTGAGGTGQPALEAHGQTWGREKVMWSFLFLMLFYTTWKMCVSWSHNFTSSFWFAGFCRRSLTSQCQPRLLHVKFPWRLTLPRTWCGISASWRVKWRGWSAVSALQNYSVSPCLITHTCTPALTQPFCHYTKAEGNKLCCKFRCTVFILNSIPD